MSLQDLLALPQESPKEWGARKDYDTWRKVTNTSQTFIHWGGSQVSARAAAGNHVSERTVLRGWEKYHIENKGWAGLAYDWAIGNSGRLYRIRGLARSAATSGDVDGDRLSNNLEGEAIVFIVGKGQTVSGAALRTGWDVLKALGNPVWGHKEARGTRTECPGEQLTYALVKAWRSGRGLEEQMIRRNDKGPAVKAVQDALLRWNPNALPKYKADGDFGGETETWVGLFQEDKGLRKTGEVDGVTAAFLLPGSSHSHSGLALKNHTHPHEHPHRHVVPKVNTAESQ